MATFAVWAHDTGQAAPGSEAVSSLDEQTAGSDERQNDPEKTGIKAAEVGGSECLNGRFVPNEAAPIGGFTTWTGGLN